MELNTTVRWAGDMTFVGHGEKTKHAIVMDAGVDAGGLGIGVSPMELLLLGVGGCASIDVIMILEKARQQVTDCVARVSGVRRDEMPRKFTDIHLHFVVTGKNLKEAQVKRAVDLSMEKYCSASATLAEAANLTFDYEVVDAE